MKKITTLLSISIVLTLINTTQIVAQIAEKEQEYYRITTIPTPEGILIEAGGVTVIQDGSVAVATRRGDIWLISNPAMQGRKKAEFHLFASGLHEPLGLAYLNGSLYTAQRGELTKLTDTNGDRIADEYRTIYSWPSSSHYHEYSFGPAVAPDNSFFITTNVAFGDGEWWRGESRVPWRGWTLHIQEDGTMEPWATGMRSPAGYGIIDGELFYSDNQGDWMGSGGIWHVNKGSFTGHPAGLKWTGEANSPVKLTEADFYAKIDKRQVVIDGTYIKPSNIPDEKDPDFLYKAKQSFPELQLPSIILPHGILGISNSEIKVDQTNGKFGPFAGQIFIGDQGQSKIMRLVMEKVNDEYQGVAFDFLSGFQSGVLRMAWDNNGVLFVGETNRGWGSAGSKNEGIEFVNWTGKMPFEMKKVKAMPDGFEVEFTLPVDKKSLEDLDSYKGKSYIYKYHAVYGSPQTNIESSTIKGVKVSDDGLKVRIVTDNQRQYYVHEFELAGIKSAETKAPLLHTSFYYTLNNIPAGDKLDVKTLSMFRSSALEKKAKAATTIAKPKAVPAKTAVLTDAQIQNILQINTCTACHKKDARVVGPSFISIAKRNYSNEKIVELIYNPQPKNWPEYATPMAPMPHVPKDEAMQIAAWINSLKKDE